jgi:acyl-CoA hydrolase
MEPKPMSHSLFIMTQVMQPTDANVYGNVHGGSIMKLVDVAGAYSAMRHCRRPVVTVAIDSMSFRAPVHIGDIVTATARVTGVGHTSLEVTVTVEAENPLTGQRTHTSTAHLVYVALDEHGQPVPVPPLLAETEEERRELEAAAQRRRARLALRASQGTQAG